MQQAKSDFQASLESIQPFHQRLHSRQTLICYLETERMFQVHVKSPISPSLFKSFAQVCTDMAFRNILSTFYTPISNSTEN